MVTGVFALDDDGPVADDDPGVADDDPGACEPLPWDAGVDDPEGVGAPLEDELGEEPPQAANTVRAPARARMASGRPARRLPRTTAVLRMFPTSSCTMAWVWLRGDASPVTDHRRVERRHANTTERFR
jgi:hypothetical protein